MILLKSQFPQLLLSSRLTNKLILSLGNKVIRRNIQNKQKPVPEPRGIYNIIL